jgi:hypothetical protein
MRNGDGRAIQLGWMVGCWMRKGGTARWLALGPGLRVLLWGLNGEWLMHASLEEEKWRWCLLAYIHS